MIFVANEVNRTYLGKILWFGLLSWNVVSGLIASSLMDRSDMNFKEVNKRYFEKTVERTPTLFKPLMYTMHVTTFPGRVSSYYLCKNLDR